MNEREPWWYDFIPVSIPLAMLIIALLQMQAKKNKTAP